MNLRHTASENVSTRPFLCLESRTNTVLRPSATSMHSPLSEALLFRHDTRSGLVGSDIEPLSGLRKRYPACPLMRTSTLREPGVLLYRVPAQEWLAAWHLPGLEMSVRLHGASHFCPDDFLLPGV